MTIPKEWQTPEAQQALRDAMQRAIDGYLHDPNRNAVGAEQVRALAHADPHPARFALPRGAELDRCVKLARQGDKLAAYRVHAVLAADLRRGTLDARERELLASMHEAIVRGADPAAAVLAAKPSSRPIKTSMHARIADWIAREIEAHAAIKARGGARCDNGCADLTNEAAYARAVALFGIGKSRAKAIYLASRKAATTKD